MIASDTLLESMLAAIKKMPWLIFLLPFWIFRGKTYFKNRIKHFAVPDPALLPYREEIIDFIRTEKIKGRKIALATATVKEIADSVAKHTELFDYIIASDESKNLRSRNKAEALIALFGEEGFDYAGDSSADIEVWKRAAGAVLVCTSGSVTSKARKNGNVVRHFPGKASKLKLFIKEIRVYQWLKNLLIFLPLLMAHKFDTPFLFWQAFTAFLAFSLSASSVYVLNDLMDLDSDRHHPRKKKRPFASGNLSIKTGLVAFPLLLITGLSLSFLLLPHSFSAILIIYLILTTLYSFVLKRLYIIDIFVLSILYTIRLLAGAFAVDVPASKWLLAFSVFLFLSLAIVKRFTELKVMQNENKNQTKGRGYFVDDIGLLLNIGPASGYLSVLVFALYIYSNEVSRIYKNPEYLWPVAICLLYWITRIWFLAHRGKMHDDPIVFTSKDYISYIIALIIAVLVIGATL